MRTANSCGSCKVCGASAWCMGHDQGYAGNPWLGALRHFDVRFVVRWNKTFQLVSAKGIKQPPFHFGRGKTGLAPRQIHDAVKKKTVEGSVLFYPVTHPDYPDWPLTLVVSRRKGGDPWYLLTNEMVGTAEDAWRIAMAYIRRWQIEMAFRNLKSEMAIQSLRVYDWEGRLKLLGMLTLAYAFLMDSRAGGRENRTRLADRLRLSSQRSASAGGGDPLYPLAHRALQTLAHLSL